MSEKLPTLKLYTPKDKKPTIKTPEERLKQKENKKYCKDRYNKLAEYIIKCDFCKEDVNLVRFNRHLKQKKCMEAQNVQKEANPEKFANNMNELKGKVSQLQKKYSKDVKGCMKEDGLIKEMEEYKKAQMMTKIEVKPKKLVATENKVEVKPIEGAGYKRNYIPRNGRLFFR